MKFLIVSSIAISGAIFSFAQAETIHSSEGFETTSGNIECLQATAEQTGGAAFVGCVRSKPSELTATIENGQVKVIPRATFSIAVEDKPVLADGSSNDYAGSTCSVASDGVTCIMKGIGFKISRKGVVVLK